jgi:hypothetical protein
LNTDYHTCRLLPLLLLFDLPLAVQDAILRHAYCQPEHCKHVYKLEEGHWVLAGWQTARVVTLWL